MIRQILIIVVVMSAGVLGRDQTEVNSNNGCLDGLEPTSWSLSSSWRSKYVFSNGANLHDKPVIQTDLFVLTKCGLMFDLWTSLPANFQDVGDDFATEVYPTFGWIGKAGDFNISLGVSYEDLHPNFDVAGPDFLILSGEVSRDFKLTPDLSFSPFVRYETNFTFGGEVQGDTMQKGGMRFAWKLNEMLSLAGKTMLVYDPGILGGDVAWVLNAETSLLWKVGEHAVVEFPFVRYVDPLNTVNDGRKNEFIFGAGLMLKF